MKNKHPRPSKGQVPDPTYSRMKFAYCTDRADSDGRGTGKKKAPCERPGLGQRVLFLFPCLPLLSHTERKGLWDKSMGVDRLKSNKILALNHHTS